MKKNRGIQKLAILALLGVLCLVIQFPINSLFRRIDKWKFEYKHKKNRMDLMLERQIKE